MARLSQFASSSAVTLCTINGRIFYKNQSGFALLGVVPKTSSSSSWVAPILVSTNSNAVRTTTNAGGDLRYNSTTTYDGKTWYVNSGQYALKGNYNPSGSFTQRVASATELLNMYYSLVTVTAGDGGTAARTMNEFSATLTATPNSGYAFVGWYKDGTLESTANPYTITVDDAVSYTAMFRVNYSVTLDYDSSLGEASYQWISATQVTFTASPNSNGQFVGWYVNSSNVSSSTSYTRTISSNLTIEARFDRVYSIDDRVDGDGAIQYTRGTDKNDVTFSVIPDTHHHLTQYEVQFGTETQYYNETPLFLHLTSDIIITAYIVEDDKFHVTASTDFPYGSIYISDNDVYSGTVVTLWARPFPDYNFVQWQDGSLENPRSIVVTENVTLVAVYQRVGDTNGIYQYRCFVKDQLNLEDPPKAFLRVDTFTVRTDLMTNATSSITVLEMPSNINEGDVLVLYDPKGQFLYNGVVNSIEDLTIGCSQMQSFYKGNWIYSTSSQDFLEHEIAVVLKDYADGKLKGSSYVDSLVAQRLGGLMIDYDGATSVHLPSTYSEDGDSSQDQYEVVDMEEFIYSLYEKYGIVFDFEINFTGTNYVHIKVPTFERIKVGNNMFAIQNMLPITEIEETNKLVIYNSQNVYRTTYIATKNGIVENPATTANRFNITNTEIVFSDDPVEDLVANNLPNQMFNHKLEYDLIIRNFIYEFGDFNLGGELDIYYGDEYYDSVLTGYEISKQSNQNITQAHFICGKVRTALTKLLTLSGRV